MKTSSKPEYDFYKSFLQWHYDIQARLYWRLIRNTMDQDDYFKDFELMNYRFIVVNKETLNPLVWDFDSTKDTGALTLGSNKQIILRDPVEIAKELKYYLDKNPKNPIGIDSVKSNNLTDWINTI